MSTDTVHSREHDKPDDSNATFFSRHRCKFARMLRLVSEGSTDPCYALTVSCSPPTQKRHFIAALLMKRPCRQRQRENTEERTKPVQPLEVRRRTSAGPSRDAVSSCWPSGEKTADQTRPSWPIKVSKAFTRGSRPHLRGLVVRSGQQLLAVGREDCRIDIVFVAHQGKQAFTQGSRPPPFAVLSSQAVSSCWPSAELAWRSCVPVARCCPLCLSIFPVVSSFLCVVHVCARFQRPETVALAQDRAKNIHTLSELGSSSASCASVPWAM